jgi:DNA modification methylase
MGDLSTRGYMNLIKSVLYGLEADILYMFTDWRMWDWTREASEASGFPVRNMIVWDKQTPGMGIQWRGQHELICFAKRTTLGGPFHKGNVLSYKRSGNDNHPTEKPVPLMIELIENTNSDTVYDPFAGSGSTLLACEQVDKRCLAMELDPRFCDILIKRWEDYTGKEAKKL